MIRLKINLCYFSLLLLCCVQSQENGNITELEEMVVSGTKKLVRKSESAVPVEVYSKTFFKSNPTPTLLDALANVNGVRPQINCNVCNTGDIHINGLEGAYTMVLIDGMPIVSGLSAVYGLSGIPQSLIDRVEVVKGAASTLYGSEAVGGLINVITKNPLTAPKISADVFATDWQEYNVDLGGKITWGNKVNNLLGLNYYNYQNPIDKNGDNFTDVTLQNRISIFNKTDIQRSDNRDFSFAARYIYEDRWGGEMQWNSNYRGGEEVYGESIYTSRWEFFGVYEMPFGKDIRLEYSLNGHNQNSVYGSTKYLANQKIAFGQLSWGKKLKKHDLLLGTAYRYTYYDDNTAATASFDNPEKNEANHTHLPGVFVQDEINFNANHKVLLGMRYDYNSIYGSIFTPRINYKWSSGDKAEVLRIGWGNGYRIVNVFTEDHAALTGAREVEFVNELKPEKSWNLNLNFVKKFHLNNGLYMNFDATAFYTYFDNKIIPDYETDVNKIIYDNLEGYAISKGISLNTHFVFPMGLKLMMGATLMDVYSVENSERTRQLFSERFTGTWTLGYNIPKWKLNIDYTGNLYSPMRLPLLGDNDPRSEYSPWWSIQNIQITKKFGRGFEIYGGVKNLLNWTPTKSEDFIIARANDPFDEQVEYGNNGEVLLTNNNPYGLTFDPSYVYAPNQGLRGFVGMRYVFK